MGTSEQVRRRHTLLWGLGAGSPDTWEYRSHYFGSHNLLRTKMFNMKKGHFSVIKGATIRIGRKVGGRVPSLAPRLLRHCLLISFYFILIHLILYYPAKTEVGMFTNREYKNYNG